MPLSLPPDIRIAVLYIHITHSHTPFMTAFQYGRGELWCPQSVFPVVQARTVTIIIVYTLGRHWLSECGYKHNGVILIDNYHPTLSLFPRSLAMFSLKISDACIGNTPSELWCLLILCVRMLIICVTPAVSLSHRPPGYPRGSDPQNQKTESAGRHAATHSFRFF